MFFFLDFRDLAADGSNTNSIYEDIPEVGLFGDIG